MVSVGTPYVDRRSDCAHTDPIQESGTSHTPSPCRFPTVYNPNMLGPSTIFILGSITPTILCYIPSEGRQDGEREYLSIYMYDQMALDKPGERWLAQAE